MPFIKEWAAKIEGKSVTPNRSAGLLEETMETNLLQTI